jgi:hypothetical protein
MTTAKTSKTPFEITVKEKGGIYTVSGKDATKLYTKMQQIPPEARTLKMGDMKDGVFTLEKIALNAISEAQNVPAATAAAG